MKRKEPVLFTTEPVDLHTDAAFEASPSTPARRETKKGLSLADLPRLAGYAILLFLGWLLFHTLLRPWVSSSATRAIIDARASVITSPIDGTVTAIHTQPGSAIKPGEVVAQVKNDTVTRDTLTHLLTRRMNLQSKLDDVDSSIQSDTQMLSYVDKQYRRYHKAGLTQLRSANASLQSQMDAASASAEAATNDYWRAVRLQGDGAISAAQVDAARDKMSQAMSNADALEQQAHSVRSSLSAAKDGIYLSGNGSEGVLPKLAQQRTTLKAQLENEKLQSKSLHKQLDDLNQLVGQEHQRVSTLSDFTVKADAGGTAQEILAPVGTRVKSGDTLVRSTDCSQSGVVAVFSSHIAPKLHQGSPIRVDLANANGPLRAHVVQLLPSASPQVQDGYSVPFPHADSSSVYALARWDKNTPEWLLKRACTPGVTVTASLM